MDIQNEIKELKDDIAYYRERVSALEQITETRGYSALEIAKKRLAEALAELKDLETSAPPKKSAKISAPVLKRLKECVGEDGKLRNIDPKTFGTVFKDAQRSKMSLKDFLAEHNFDYDFRNGEITKKVNALKAELLIYLETNDDLLNLRRNNKNLYTRIITCAQRLGKTPTEFLEELGFSYPKKNRQEKNNLILKPRIQAHLDEFKTFSRLKKFNPKLYYSLHEYARSRYKDGKRINQIISDLGFNPYI
jgi:hypothetical protein